MTTRPRKEPASVSPPPRPRIPAWMPMQLRAWSRRQWTVAGWSYLAALLVMGIVGETLPGASQGRAVPVEWWNYLTLVLSPPLIALIVATFVPNGQSKRPRTRSAAGAGAGGLIGTIAMACPMCNPIAIPLFGTAGVLSFLAPDRGLIALLSIALLAVTLTIRLRTTRTCQLSTSPLPHDETAGHSRSHRIPA